jgi:hypothetical protein
LEVKPKTATILFEKKPPGSCSCEKKRKGYIVFGMTKEWIENVPSNKDCFAKCKAKSWCKTAVYYETKRKCLLYDFNTLTPGSEDCLFAVQPPSSTTLIELWPEGTCEVTTLPPTTTPAPTCEMIHRGYIVFGIVKEWIGTVPSNKDCFATCKAKSWCQTAVYYETKSKCLLYDFNTLTPGSEDCLFDVQPSSSTTLLELRPEGTCEMTTLPPTTTPAPTCEKIRNGYIVFGMVQEWVPNIPAYEVCFAKCKQNWWCKTAAYYTDKNQCLLYNFNTLTPGSENCLLAVQPKSSTIILELWPEGTCETTPAPTTTPAAPGQECYAITYNRLIIGQSIMQRVGMAIFDQCITFCHSLPNCKTALYYRNLKFCMLYDFNSISMPNLFFPAPPSTGSIIYEIQECSTTTMTTTLAPMITTTSPYCELVRSELILVGAPLDIKTGLGSKTLCWDLCRGSKQNGCKGAVYYGTNDQCILYDFNAYEKPDHVIAVSSVLDAYLFEIRDKGTCETTTTALPTTSEEETTTAEITTASTTEASTSAATTTMDDRGLSPPAVLQPRQQHSRLPRKKKQRPP